jgi:hypothetical protein
MQLRNIAQPAAALLRGDSAGFSFGADRPSSLVICGTLRLPIWLNFWLDYDLTLMGVGEDDQTRFVRFDCEPICKLSSKWMPM